MTTAAEFSAQADEKFTELKALVDTMKEAAGQDSDKFAALKAQADELGQTVGDLKSQADRARATEEQAAMVANLTARISELESARTPSKAAAIAAGSVGRGQNDVETFFLSLAIAQNPKLPQKARMEAEEALERMGSTWTERPSESQGTIGSGKAVTGSTAAGGGYIVPEALANDITSVGRATNPYRTLMTVITGVDALTINLPHIGLAPTRAVVVSRGSTKTNVDLVLTNYSATMYTLAQITDLVNQWMRQTGGQGERIVRDRLGAAIAIGEAYYILNGTGTSEPKGLLTSLGASGTFVSSHTASNSTIAGNFATGIAKAAGAIGLRYRNATGVVMNTGDFWTAMAQGADAAGFYVAPTGGATSVNAIGAFDNGSPVIRVWGLPVYADQNMPADSLVVGDWKQAELYIGADYRIDTSSEAGTRWDQNLTGFRAEEDIAFNADPYVQSGCFQRIVDAVA